MDMRHTTAEGRAKSPNRRLSKIPSCTNLPTDAGSPGRKAAAKPTTSKVNSGGEEMFKAVMQRNMGGRTLVELSQARTGGKPIDDAKKNVVESRLPTTVVLPQPASVTVKTMVDREPPATWDPDLDEMPSPFLARGNKVIRNFR
jgi:NIMA (never in mitosis gene a)-related kinase